MTCKHSLHCLPVVPCKTELQLLTVTTSVILPLLLRSFSFLPYFSTPILVLPGITFHINYLHSNSCLRIFLWVNLQPEKWLPLPEQKPESVPWCMRPCILCPPTVLPHIHCAPAILISWMFLEYSKHGFNWAALLPDFLFLRDLLMFICYMFIANTLPQTPPQYEYKHRKESDFALGFFLFLLSFFFLR